jgi:hypothetical protein
LTRLLQRIWLWLRRLILLRLLLPLLHFLHDLLRIAGR